MGKHANHPEVAIEVLDLHKRNPIPGRWLVGGHSVDGKLCITLWNLWDKLHYKTIYLLAQDCFRKRQDFSKQMSHDDPIELGSLTLDIN